MVEQDRLVARAQPLGGVGPPVAALHEPGDEDQARHRQDDRVASGRPWTRSTAPTPRCRHSSTSSSAAGCVMRSPARVRATRPIALTLAAQEGLEAISVIDERCGGIRRARDGEGERPPGRGHLHVRHGRGEPSPRRGRGVGGARAADRPDRRPPARAARGRAPARRSTRPGSTARPRSGSWTSARTNRAARRRSTTARSRAAPTGLRRAGAPGRCTSTSRCASRWPRSPRNSSPRTGTAAPDGRPWTRVRGQSRAPQADDVQHLAARVATNPRGAIVCGPAAERDRRARGAPRGRAAAGRCSPSRRPACAAESTTARTWSRTTTCCFRSRSSPPPTGPASSCA